jgi:hypothetical protein
MPWEPKSMTILRSEFVILARGDEANVKCAQFWKAVGFC